MPVRSRRRGAGSHGTIEGRVTDDTAAALPGAIVVATQVDTGIAPLTAGIATAGGTLRQGQAYAVNGMRPEQNAYLVDGGLNANRVASVGEGEASKCSGVVGGTCRSMNSPLGLPGVR